ncbi:MAG: PolC-type DNA polymerase III [Clostridia bacterium]|nr:PolC-type DNA polymerase III [Clostridia bacterium]
MQENQRSIFEILKKYQPSAYADGILSNVTDFSVRADKEKRLLEICASFPSLVDKDDLYTIEEEICRAYDLQYVKILPHYPQTLFTQEYIPQILKETERIGIVARGFFAQYKATLNERSLVIEVPFEVDGGIRLMENGQTPQVIERIIFSEFGLQCHVEIKHSQQLYRNTVEESRNRRLETIDQQIAKAEVEYNRMMETRRANPDYARDGGESGGDDKQVLPRISSIYTETPPQAVVEDGICTIGFSKFDLREPEVLIGDAFEIGTPAVIASFNVAQRGLVIVGDVFGYTADTTRSGDKYNVVFSVFDGNSSIEVKKYGLTPEEAKELGDTIKDGMSVALYGYIKKESHKNGLDLDFSFFYSAAMKIKKIKRVDNAPVKRVELHLHTTMSSMDALIPPDTVVKTANAWGMPAIAITDHGNVQAYQKAMLASEKLGQKVIYGMEGYFVDDKASALFGRYEGAFDDECIVFDIETTGLSNRTCKITEIGAVRIKNGAVIDSFNTFVNPEVPIPEDIVKLTSITDEMVADAPKVKQALEAFFAFIGNEEGKQPKLLIAHNAEFDVGFIRYNAELCGLPFPNAYLDTVALSRFINPDLKSHKLDVVAKYYGLGDFNHHRACDDADMLAQIFFCMVNKMKESELHDYAALQREMLANANPLKLKTYHQVLLVKNKVGLKNLYRLVSFSYLNYYHRQPRIPKTELEKYREGLIIGSACESGELVQAILDNKPEAVIEDLVNFYDYLEIQPICNNRFLVAEGKIADDEGLRDLNRRIVALGERYGKPVVATCDAHFLNREDEVGRKILLAGMKFKDADRDIGLYLRTTEEMLEEFSYLGEEKAYEVVVTNTNMIADMIESDIRPFPKGTFTPHMDGAEEDLQRICYEHAEGQYGKPLPEIVGKRLEKELTSIIKNGFAVLYMIAQKLVWYSESQGYLVGSRGSVGSSFVASCAGISEVNPLPPHYYCPNCKHSEFFTDGSVGSGFDLPDANCPKCGTKLVGDGHDIPFETFLGFYGDKSPDIDLNFSGEVQGKVHKYTEELFGAENVFRAGTIGEVADKTAYGFILKYLEEKGVSLSRSEMNRLVSCCVGVKRTTGQHPGGIVVVPKEYEIYDFCPVQHPADDPKSDIVTTHFTFEYLHDTLLKLDELGHDMPTKYKWLERYSGTSVMDVKMNDASIYELFQSTAPLGISPDDIGGCQVGTWGIPEMGTRFLQQVLIDAKPKNFADLLQISGLTHGTDVWLGNAQDLIKEGICDISKVIGCRDGIMLDLIRYGLDNAMSFKIMESVRKGKGLTPEWEAEMRAHDVPEWYIGSCKKIKYMFPKAHAAAYVMSAIRLGWYKIYMPTVFYAAMFTVAPNGFDAEIVLRGKKYVENYIKDVEKRGKEASPKEQSSISTFQLVMEAYARGIKFLPIDINKSEAHCYRPEGDRAIRLPFSSLPGLGDTAAENIEKARTEEPFFSVEDLQIRAKLTKAVIEILRRNNVLDNIDETDQMTLFSFL